MRCAAAGRLKLGADSSACDSRRRCRRRRRALQQVKWSAFTKPRERALFISCLFPIARWTRCKII
jgi:hypothetical protein